MDNNYSFLKLNESIEGLYSLLNSNLINSTPKQLEELSKLRSQRDEMLKMMKDFNEKFSSLGWCSSETSINTNIIKRAIQISKDKGFSAADDYLVKAYNDSEIQYRLMSLYSVPALKKRLKFIKNAYQDHLAGRYYSAIPLLLMMIDGAVSDIAESNKGFHSEMSTVEAWDSIIGHESGLSQIKKLIHKTRGKTTNESISIPYRNGILHGRDLGYDSRKVSVKCWFLLYSVADWARAKSKEPMKLKEFQEESKKKQNYNLSELINDISVAKKEMDDLTEAYENSERQVPLLGIDIPFKGESHQYFENTPEKEVVMFLEHWKNERWDLMAQQSFYNPKYKKLTKAIGELKNIFIGKILNDFVLHKIDDISLSITEINVKCDIEYKNSFYKERGINFRVIYCGIEDTDPLPRGLKGGKWKIINNSDIDYLGQNIDYLDNDEL